jgi:hypothetical protein
MNWQTLSVEEKIEYKELINSDFLFSLTSYLASFPENQIEAE